MSTVTQHSLQDHIRAVRDAFAKGTLDDMRLQLQSLPPAAVAHLVESVPLAHRQFIWGLLPDEEHRNQTLNLLSEEVRAEFLEEMDAADLISLGESIGVDDFADILHELPDTIAQLVLDSMNSQDRERVEQVLSWPDDCAGGLMDTDTVTVRPWHTLELVLRYLQRFDHLPASTDSLIVTDSGDQYVGVLPLTRLLTTARVVTVREAMITDLEPIPAALPDTEVAYRFATDDLISAPVVDDDQRLLGRITVDDVVDVIMEDADEVTLGRAGLDDDNLFITVTRAARGRALWLGLNLATAFLVASVINLFEDTIRNLVTLAILMPIVASMGGIAGTQTLTLVVRGMALGQVGRANMGWLLQHEILVAILNGLLLGTLVALGTALIFGDLQLSIVIAVAIMLNMSIAGIAGTLLPPVLTMLRIDPAIAGGVVLTTITDMAGFLTFLGLATLLLM